MDTQDWIRDRKDLLALLPYEEKGIVSKQILKGDGSNAIVYSIYEGEKLACNSFPNDVLMVGLEGKAILTLDKEDFDLGALVSMVIPRGTKYSLVATSNFKVLVILKI